ncbi:hypothetical protein GCM10027614_77940 [Micromonospora vulcania]
MQATDTDPDAALRPTAPDVALGATLLRRQEDLEAARQRVTQLAEEYRSGLRRHHVDHLVEVITGARVLRDRLRDLQNSARTEVLWFCRANPRDGRPGECRGVRRAGPRVSYRAIYERDLLLEPGALTDLAKGSPPANRPGCWTGCRSGWPSWTRVPRSARWCRTATAVSRAPP